MFENAEIVKKKRYKLINVWKILEKKFITNNN